MIWAKWTFEVEGDGARGMAEERWGGGQGKEGCCCVLALTPTVGRTTSSIERSPSWISTLFHLPTFLRALSHCHAPSSKGRPCNTTRPPFLPVGGCEGGPSPSPSKQRKSASSCCDGALIEWGGPSGKGFSGIVGLLVRHPTRIEQLKSSTTFTVSLRTTTITFPSSFKQPSHG